MYIWNILSLFHSYACDEFVINDTRSGDIQRVREMMLERENRWDNLGLHGWKLPLKLGLCNRQLRHNCFAFQLFLPIVSVYCECQFPPQKIISCTVALFDVKTSQVCLEWFCLFLAIRHFVLFPRIIATHVFFSFRHVLSDCSFF